MEHLKVTVVGASGFVGAELIRLLLGHPRVAIAGLFAGRHAGDRLSDHFPQFAGRVDSVLDRYLPTTADEIAARAPVSFLALPHGESASLARELYTRGLSVIDLSADFRLRDAATYQSWYGPHPAPELLPQAVYGLVERHRAALIGSRLIAVPGCFPTATLLALAPLLAANLIVGEGLIVDAKTGVSGAGRAASPTSHFAAAHDGVRAYKVASHRHTPEIEQELSHIVGRPLAVTFTPHLVPMSRGILATCYAIPTDEKASEDVYRSALRDAYQDAAFVAVVDKPPDTAHLRGSNRVHLSVVLDRRARRVIAMGAIDNLVKGAAGQAIQCLNVQQEWSETEGLEAVGLFP